MQRHRWRLTIKENYDTSFSSHIAFEVLRRDNYDDALVYIFYLSLFHTWEINLWTRTHLWGTKLSERTSCYPSCLQVKRKRSGAKTLLRQLSPLFPLTLFPHNSFIDYWGISHNAFWSYSFLIPSRPTLPPCFPRKKLEKENKKITASPICVTYILTRAWSSSQCPVP